jgi:hypothetical protein
MASGNHDDESKHVMELSDKHHVLTRNTMFNREYFILVY